MDDLKRQVMNALLEAGLSVEEVGDGDLGVENETGDQVILVWQGV